MENWQVILLEPAKLVLSQIGQFLVSLLLVIVILIFGWIVSRIVKAVVIKVLQSVKLDVLSERIELKNLLDKGGIKYTLSELLGVVCYWLALLVTFVVAINAVGLTIAADLLNRVVLYIPNIIAAIFILILGMFVATLLRNIVYTAATNAGLSQVKLLGRVVEIATLVFAAAIALEQLNIGAKIIELIVGITLASFGFGLALAFGLGCKDLVARHVNEFIERMSKK